MNGRVNQIRWSVLTLALPVTVSSLLQRAEGILGVFLVGGLGAEPIAAVGLSQLLIFIAATLLAGFSVSGNVLVAQLWGARRTRDAGEAALHLVGLSLIASALLALLGVATNGLTMAALGVLAGSLLGLGATFYLVRVFGVVDIGPVPFVSAAAVVGVVALAASAIPAWRASRLSPMVAIRNQRD